MPITGSQPAKMFAQMGMARVGATRVGYASGLVFVNLGGSYPCVLYDSLTITDELDETPNRATFTLKNTVPPQGQAVIITRGSKNSLTPLFAGHVLGSTQEHRAQVPTLLLCHVNAVDYTWQLGFQKVTAKYQNQLATTIAKDLITTYAAVNGFTTNHVSPALPTIDEITFTNEDLTDAVTRLCRRIGAYWYVDYVRDVHVFFEETGNPPEDLTPTHRSLSALAFERDRTQALSRVYVEGRGTRLLSNVLAGDTRLPVEAVDMFLVAPDVFLKVSYQGSEGGAKHLDFTGVVTGGSGTLVGPGATPSAAPLASPVAGTAVTSGVHDYAVSFTTASGESLPGPRVTANVGVLPAAPVMVGLTAVGSGSGSIYGNWQCKITFFAADGSETLASPASNVITNTLALPNLVIQVPLGPVGTVKRRLYYKEPGAGSYRAWQPFFDIQNNTTTELAVASQMNGPLINEPTGASRNQVNLTAIPIGNASVTARKIYRTAAGLSQLKLLATLADNTTSTYTDTLADAALGANAPATDTSGLQQPPGQVSAGATTLIVAGTGAFAAAGGWAIIGNGEQVIRYTGLTASALTGIPASGTGAITATIAYNSTVTAAPMLTGIPATGPRSIVRELVAGDEVYLVVQVENSTAQSILAAMGGNGWREEWVQDRRLAIPEARARGQATLQLRPADELRCTYTCRDTRTASGKSIALALFGLVATLKIQAVTIKNFRSHPRHQPTYTVQASSQRHSFDDLLRRARYKE